jgi:hypothetical protein
LDLRNHISPLHDEMAYNIHYGLEDYWYARRLLRAVGPEGRARFSEEGWAYGDPSYGYGTDPFEVFRFQARVVAKTLFGDALTCDLHCFPADDETLYDFLEGLRDREGFLAFSDAQGGLQEYYAYEDGAVLVAELTGDPEWIWRLKGALTQLGTDFVYYGPEQEDAGDPSQHLLILYDAELYPERETIHHKLFETLIKAKEAIVGQCHGC